MKAAIRDEKWASSREGSVGRAQIGQYEKAMEALMRFAGTPSFVIGSRPYPGVPEEKRLKEAIAMARG